MKPCYIKVNITLNSIQYLKNTCCYYEQNKRYSYKMNVFVPFSRRPAILNKEEFEMYFSEGKVAL